jgi:small subunit ribosomal protein S16
MLTIRLQRTGRANLPTYRIVVAEHSAPIKGRFNDIVGHYLPNRNPAVLEYKKEQIVEWIKKGARPSNTVARLLKKDGFADIDMEKYIDSYTKKKKRKASDEEESAPPAAESAETTPKEEVKAEESTPAEEKTEEPPKEEAPKEEEVKSDDTDDKKE